MQQGLHENRNQFILLVLVNAFVGAMVGLERTVMPDYAAARFQMDSTVALVSFIAAFGTTTLATALAYTGLSGERLSSGAIATGIGNGKRT